MKAIINVRKGSTYSKYNGFTFEVSQLWSHSIDLIGANPEFPNNSVNFLLNEVTIVDIKAEVAVAEYNLKIREKFPNSTMYQDYLYKLECLKRYCILKKISLEN